MFPNETNAELAKLNEQNFLQQKRRCAKTFEEMIFVRISEHFHSGSGNGNGNGGEDRIGTMTNHTTTNNDSQAMNDCNKTNGLQKLLDNGIIQSVISLCSIQDTITQNHCARAL
jgi:hypothetical protein